MPANTSRRPDMSQLGSTVASFRNASFVHQEPNGKSGTVPLPLKHRMGQQQTGNQQKDSRDYWRYNANGQQGPTASQFQTLSINTNRQPYNASPNAQQERSSESQGSMDTNQPARKRRRVAVAKACYHCRKAHAKCSNDRPCTRCTKRNLKCYEHDPNEEDATRKGSSHSNSLAGKSISPHAPSRDGAIPNGVTQTYSSPQSGVYVPNMSHLNAHAHNDMTYSLTQTIKQQSQLIQQLLDKKNELYVQTQGERVKEKVVMKENPFVDAFPSDTEAAAMWRSDCDFHGMSLLFANDTFCKMLDCDLSDIQGVTIHVYDIPKLILGRFGRHAHRELDGETKQFEQRLKKMFSKLHNRDKSWRRELARNVSYMKRKIVLNMQICEAEVYKKDGITFTRYRRCETFDDAMTINDRVLAPTFSITNFRDISEDVILRMMMRMTSSLEKKEDDQDQSQQQSQNITNPIQFPKVAPSPTPSNCGTPNISTPNLAPSSNLGDDDLGSFSLDDFALDDFNLFV